MRLGDFVPSFLKGEPAKEPAAGDMSDAPKEPALQSPVAYANSTLASAMYAAYDGVKYNPDDLLTRKGFDIYKKMMLDEQLKGIVRFKQAAILARGFMFVCEDESLSEEERERRVKLFEHIVSRVDGSFRTSLYMVLRSMWQGFSITEKVHKDVMFEEKTYRGIKSLKPRPFETFYVKTDDYGIVTALCQRVPGKQEVEVPLNRVIYMVHNADMDEHYGQSDLRECYRDYFSKDMAIRFRNIYNERMAAGMTFLEQEASSTVMRGSADWLALEKALKNISVSTGILLPKGIKANVVHPDSTTAFHDTIVDCNLGMAKALLIPNLLGITETGQTGAYSQSQTQFEAFMWTLGDTINLLEETLNEQLFAELGRWNFADGIAPKFKFKPLTDSQRNELLTTWTNALKGGAVEASDTDEKHVRELLNFPDKGEPLKKPGLVDPVTGLPLPAPKLGPDGKPLPAEEQPPKKEPEPLEETVRGRTLRPHIKHGAERTEQFIAAEHRVQFAIIDHKTKRVESAAVEQLRNALREGIKEMVTAMVRLGAENAVQLEAIEFPGASKGSVRRALTTAMTEAAYTSLRHAKQEVNDAQRKMKRAHFTPLDNEQLLSGVMPYIEGRAYTGTGMLVTDAENIARAAVLNGIKAGNNLELISRNVYNDLAHAGFLSAADLAEVTGLDETALAELMGDAELTLGRVRTAVRTNVFDAFNEARFDYFTDPALNGFVEALQYSAVLDDNTTDICEQLDGETWPAEDSIWDTYRPPNHFNCRSILIPLVVGDTWTESDAPKVEPQKGFGG